MNIGGESAGVPERPGEGLWVEVQNVTRRALASGALRPIATESEIISDGGIDFLVRILSSLDRKNEERWRRERDRRPGSKEENPFLPYEEELFVAGLTESHLCLLNKFNVVEHHLLIVTRQFEDQDEYLGLGDMEALLTGLAAYPSLGFYNGGRIAGASQRHKHLQLVPLPLAPTGEDLPVNPVLRAVRLDGEVGHSTLPFLHGCGAVDPVWLRSPSEGAAGALELFHRLLLATGMEPEAPHEGKRQSGPYNLLATAEWMLLVPRGEEFFEGVSVNALGFAGALLVRNAAELSLLRKRGPMSVLRQVALPAGL